MKVRKLTKIIYINIIVFITLLFSLETSHRFLKLVLSCKHNCDFSVLSFKPYKESIFLGLSKKDSKLGYENAPNFSQLINIRGWNKTWVSTDKNGLRNSSPKSIKSLYSILTVGDSYAFGAQVSDKDTWQSCLNINFKNKQFLNAGVNGYGTAQAILRAEKLYPIIQPDALMVQTTVGRDFRRDKLSIRSGFVKPYLSKTSKKNIEIIFPDSFDIPNTKYSDKKSLKFKDFLIVNFTFLDRLPSNKFFKNLLENYHESKLKLTSNISRNGKNPASIKEIINWSINRANSLDVNAIWLLQYPAKIDDNVLIERDLLKSVLQENNVTYIDTYEFLHGKLNMSTPIRKLWRGHHTPLGNERVCKTILNSGKYNK